MGSSSATVSDSVILNPARNLNPLRGAAKESEQRREASMKRILCIWLPNWPIQRIVAAQPKLKSRPVLLHWRDPRRGLRVAACSSAARRLGVRRDMPLTEATSLVEREVKSSAAANSSSNCSQHVLIEPHRPESDQAELAELAVWCQQFSPLVGWETVAAKSLLLKRQTPNLATTGHSPTGPSPAGGSPSHDFLLLDVTGLGAIFGSEAKLAQLVAKSFRGRDLYGSVAVASCLGAAWALARYGRFSIAPSAQTPAPTVPPGSVRGKPDRQGSPLQASFGGDVLPRSRAWFAEEEAEELGRLPMEALRVSLGVLESLWRLGIRRVEELEKLPKSSLPSRFGASLLLRLEQLRDRAPETLTAHRAPTEFREVWVCDTPTFRRADVEQVVRQLTGRVCRLLAERDRGAIRLLCIVHQQEGAAEQLQVELFQPTCSGEHLWDLMQMQLEQFRLVGAAVKIELTAAISAPLKVQQAELFGDVKRSRSRQFSLLLDRLAARLGGDRVLRPRATADPQPERNCVLEPANGGLRRRRKKKQASKRTNPAAHRPLQLFSAPREIETVAVAGCPPGQFQYQGQSHRVARHWGPERIETGWWRGPSVRRDYYRIETDEGRRFWLFRELTNRRWFLHGAYG